MSGMAMKPTKMATLASRRARKMAKPGHCCRLWPRLGDGAEVVEHGHSFGVAGEPPGGRIRQGHQPDEEHQATGQRDPQSGADTRARVTARSGCPSRDSDRDEHGGEQGVSTNTERGDGDNEQDTDGRPSDSSVAPRERVVGVRAAHPTQPDVGGDQHEASEQGRVADTASAVGRELGSTVELERCTSEHSTDDDGPAGRTAGGEPGNAGTSHGEPPASSPTLDRSKFGTHRRWPAERGVVDPAAREHHHRARPIAAVRVPHRNDPTDQSIDQPDQASEQHRANEDDNHVVAHVPRCATNRAEVAAGRS